MVFHTDDNASAVATIGHAQYRLDHLRKKPPIG
jgi:hypothetical protein